jgi:hypothetical protein
MQRAVFCGTLALAVLASFAQATARAEDGEEKKSIWDIDPVDDVMRGLGFKTLEEPDVYRERSPLVIPPSRNLPPPQPKAANAVPPSWPVDPNATKRKEAAKAKLYTQANKSNQNSLNNEFGNGAPISPSELNKAGTEVTGSTRASGEPVDPRADPEAAMMPSKLGFTGIKSFFNNTFNDKPELGTFTAEPPRADLTQPPTGYQTPSPTAPYGLINKKERYKTCDVDIASGTCK